MRITTFGATSLLTFLSLALALGAQEGGKPKDQKSAYEELERVPEKYRAKRNPMEQDPDAVRAGGVLFAEHCEQCHGKEAAGGKKAPSLRALEVQSATPGALYYILSNGVVRKGMPVWSKLPEPERWQLVSYLKSLGVASAGAPQPGKP